MEKEGVKPYYEGFRKIFNSGLARQREAHFINTGKFLGETPNYVKRVYISG